MQQTVSLKIDKKQAEELFNNLVSKGYISEDPKSEYVIWRLKNDLNVAIYYKSASLVVQGQGDLDEIKNLVEKDVENDKPFSAHLGSDEVGKGDYFGPLVVCCAYLDVEGLNVVRGLKIADSKTLSDEKMLNIFEKVKNKLNFEVSVQMPAEYNRRVKDFKNVSYYLAALHREVAEGLISKLKSKNIVTNMIVIDQFSLNKSRLGNEFINMGLKLSQFHKGESDIVVALASVIARACFLIELRKMSEKYSFEFPKGATFVIEKAKEFVSKYGVEELKNVAKVSFRTTSQVISF